MVSFRGLPTRSRLRSAIVVIFLTLCASGSRADYAQLDVLAVVYPESFACEAVPAEIERGWGAVERGAGFFWEHSRMRLLLHVDRLVVDRPLAPDQMRKFGDDRYWLGPRTADGIHSVEQDLRDRGVANDTYDVVAVFYAWRNAPGHLSRYGGACRPPGALLGRAAYVAIPLAWSQDGIDQIFRHEMLHVLASIFAESGYADFPDVHNREAFEAVYGRGTALDWHSWILNSLPSRAFVAVAQGPWGQLVRFPEEPGYGLGEGRGYLAPPAAIRD